MSVKIFVPGDSTALAAGADATAQAVSAQARARKLDVEIVRTGSRGLYWLEPLVEVESAKGRIGYGPVGADDAASLFDSGFLTGGALPKALGLVEEIPYLKRQQRLVFARCGVIDPLSLADYQTYGGLLGLRRAQAVGPARQRTDHVPQMICRVAPQFDGLRAIGDDNPVAHAGGGHERGVAPVAGGLREQL